MVEYLVSWICIFIFKIKGWKVKNRLPSGIKKLVIVAAPHTSNWDAVYAKAGLAIQGIRVSYAIKKEALFFPMGYILNSVGAISIDRNNSERQGIVSLVSKKFSESDSFFFIISPEGSRKRVEKWKTGFYYIAKAAKVEIAAGYIDYEKKEVGWGPLFFPSEDVNIDIEKLKFFFKDKKGKYPDLGV